jgi:hypothetical protein
MVEETLLHNWDGGLTFLASTQEFSPSPAIFAAAEDLRYLLNRGYSRDRALLLVGDRHQLSKTDRLLLYRSVYASSVSKMIRSKQLPASLLQGMPTHIDGYNVLITVETGLRNGPLVVGDDGMLRDLAGRYSSFSPTGFTDEAVHLIFLALAEIHPQRIHILFDRPISQSGELAAKCGELLTHHGLNGLCETSRTVDKDLMQVNGVVCSSDSVILKAAEKVFDLSLHVLAPLKVKMLDLRRAL